MSQTSEELPAPVKIKEEPPDDTFVIDCNPWEIKQEPDDDVDDEIAALKPEQIKTEAEAPESTKKHVIFPKDYERTTPFHCRVCGKRFSELQLLANHTSIHERTTKCEVCGARVHPKALSTHIRTEHRVEEIFRCPTCFASFKIEANLQQHMKRHEMKFVYRIEK